MAGEQTGGGGVGAAAAGEEAGAAPGGAAGAVEVAAVGAAAEAVAEAGGEGVMGGAEVPAVPKERKTTAYKMHILIMFQFSPSLRNPKTKKKLEVVQISFQIC